MGSSNLVWIIMAWKCSSPEVTVKDFMKCCISMGVDGTDDDRSWNDSEDEGDVRAMKAHSL
jgi:basic membrane lipoprotein Med (substrate-binding protein (PBP1-ABC) superfamily)